MLDVGGRADKIIRPVRKIDALGGVGQPTLKIDQLTVGGTEL